VKGRGNRGQETGDRRQGSECSGPSPALPPGFMFVESPADFKDEAALVVRVPRGVRSKEKLLAILADKLRLPGYFGGNWDALEDSLRDLTWLPSGRSVIIVHEDLPFGLGGENRGHYLAILQSAAEHWAANRQREFRVVLPQAARDTLQLNRA
jgi:Barstar (barnase inhibitor)